MHRTDSFCVDAEGWIHCPQCRCKTRAKIRPDTVLVNFPVYCPKCKKEFLIDVEDLKVSLSQEPDVKSKSR